MTKKQDNSEEMEEVEKKSTNDIPTSSFESSIETSFFYTNDKFINQIDNDEIFNFIHTRYPLLSVENTDAIIKKQIIVILNDVQFVKLILKTFNLTIFELFTLLYKQYSTIFKGPYIKKIKNTIAGKPYIENERKKTDY